MLGNGILNSTVVVRRDVLNQVGGFSTDIRENSVQDYELWLRCARVTRFECIREKLVTYRVHPSQGMWHVRTSHSQLINMLEKTVGAPESHQSQNYRKSFARILSELGVEHLDARDIVGARACFKRAMHLCPNARNILYAGCSQLPLMTINLLRRARSHSRSILGRKTHSNVPEWTGRINNSISGQELGVLSSGTRPPGT